MEPECIAKLTEKQRACLRLVLLHYSSKEIARELGIGVDAVDQRLKGAMKNLGVQNRIEAARMLASFEGTGQLSPIYPHAVESETESRPNRFVRFWRYIYPCTRRGRFILWASLITLPLGLVDFAAPLEDWYRDIRTEPGSRRPSGTIVIVAMDDRSNAELGVNKWSRSILANLVNRLHGMGASDIMPAISVSVRRDPKGDRELAEAFRNVGSGMILPVIPPDIVVTDKPGAHMPLPEFRQGMRMAHVALLQMPFRHIRRIPYQIKIGGQSYPAVSAVLGSSTGMRWERDLTIDYSIDPAAIPTVSAIDILRGTVPKSQIVGKSVLIGRTGAADINQEGARAAEYGIWPGVYFAALGAETLLAGPPIQLPWLVPMLLALAIAFFCARVESTLAAWPAILGGITFLMVAPWLLDPFMIYMDITAPIFLLMIIGLGLGFSSLKRRRRPGRDGNAPGKSIPSL